MTGGASFSTNCQAIAVFVTKFGISHILNPASVSLNPAPRALRVLIKNTGNFLLFMKRTQSQLKTNNS
jgi:hypothetical protein